MLRGLEGTLNHDEVNPLYSTVPTILFNHIRSTIVVFFIYKISTHLHNI